VIRASELISPAYLDEQRTLHTAPRGYGQRGYKWADHVRALAVTHQCGSILDYGCGAGSLAERLRENPGEAIIRIAEYDPAIPGKSLLPAFADMVVCTDVMEHVECDRIPAVIAHLGSLTRKVLFIVVSLVPTAKALSNGEQAHISLHESAWWRDAFGREFDVVEELTIKPEKQWVAVLRPRGAIA